MLHRAVNRQQFLEMPEYHLRLRHSQLHWLWMKMTMHVHGTNSPTLSGRMELHDAQKSNKIYVRAALSALIESMYVCIYRTMNHFPSAVEMMYC